jgi:hypothetical protein
LDTHRVPELRAAVLEQLQARYPTSICRIEEHAYVECFAWFACTIHVGQDRIEFILRDVVSPEKKATGRHTLRVSTPNTKGHTFRETKAGWFVVQHVVQHIVCSLQAENLLRQQAARERQLVKSAENTIIRLQRRGVPEGVQLEPHTDGNVNIHAQGLTEETMNAILDAIREQAWGKKGAKSEKGLWDHLHDDEF